MVLFPSRSWEAEKGDTASRLALSFHLSVPASGDRKHGVLTPAEQRLSCVFLGDTFFSVVRYWGVRSMSTASSKVLMKPLGAT